jgi:hypothetical protein
MVKWGRRKGIMGDGADDALDCMMDMDELQCRVQTFEEAVALGAEEQLYDYDGSRFSSVFSISRGETNMAMQSGKSPLTGKMKGFADANRGLVGKPIEIKGGRLPSGINGGVAVLSSTSVGMYPADHKIEDFRNRPYWRAAAVAKAPEEHGGQHVRGTQFFLSEPLFDTPKSGGKRKTQAEHVNFMREKLTGLGLDYDGLIGSLPEGATDDQALALVEAGCNALTPAMRAKSGIAPVYFRFRTWLGKQAVISGPDAAGKWTYEDFRGKKTYASKEVLLKANPYAESEPMVNVDWEGVCEFSDNGEATPGVVTAVEDNTGGTVETTDEQGGETEDEGSVEENAEDGGEETATEVDLDALAALADKKDDASQRQLLAMATELGLERAADVADNWVEVASLIRAASESGQENVEEAATEDESVAEDEAVTEDEPFVPVVGTVYRWPVGKSKKDQREIVVTKVSTKNETVLANSNTTKKPLLGAKDKKPLVIKWAALEPA